MADKALVARIRGRVQGLETREIDPGQVPAGFRILP